jgi:hypothetical protein
MIVIKKKKNLQSLTEIRYMYIYIYIFLSFSLIILPNCYCYYYYALDREKLCRDFVSKVYGMVANLHPSVHPITLDARTKIFTKIELALKIAMSKHQTVSANTTLFGRHQVESCVACNRPMNKSATKMAGDYRAVPTTPLPGSINIGEHAVTTGYVCVCVIYKKKKK